MLEAVRRLFSGHERIFRLLNSLALQEQAVSPLLPGSERVLVLAPHMDDEILGCGGTIAIHADAGATVCIAYLTDGRYGAGPGQSAQSELVDRRQAEARQAAVHVGVKDLRFIAGLGNRLERDSAAVKCVRELLLELRPEVVYLPFVLERHPDHRATGDLLSAAVAGGRFEFECRSYEVWTPLIPNRVIDIDLAVERKRAALRCYASQLEHTDFMHSVIALNGYRSSMVPGGRCRYAEAFHAAPVSDYLALHRHVRKRLTS